MAFSGSHRTRLGLAAVPRGLYGSFIGKTETDVSGGAAAADTVLIRKDTFDAVTIRKSRTVTVR